MDTSLAALAAFAVVMSITPGPNNVMLASVGASRGFGASLPLVFGITIGFTIMLMVIAAGAGSVLLGWPLLLPVMRWAGAAWMLWLAWQIATAPPPSEAPSRRVLGFWGGAGFQWINPKAWLIAIGVVSEFARPDLSLVSQLLRIGGVFFVAALPCTVTWVLIGRGAARLLRRPHQLRLFNLAMAALLVASLVPVLVGE